MTEIERKALELVNEVSDGFHDVTSVYDIHTAKALRSALCRAIEQHEAFRQEVSDAVEHFKRCYPGYQHASLFDRFIIAKPDPLVEAMVECGFGDSSNAADDIRAALAKRGLEIREKSDADTQV